MSGNYPDGVNQAEFDRAHEHIGSVDDSCKICGASADKECDFDCHCERCNRRSTYLTLRIKCLNREHADHHAAKLSLQAEQIGPYDLGVTENEGVE